MTEPTWTCTRSQLIDALASIEVRGVQLPGHTKASVDADDMADAILGQIPADPDASAGKGGGVSAKARTDLLTTAEMYNLDVACGLITRAFRGGPAYLVGTAADGSADSYRDVDVRLMLDDDEFAEVCPSMDRWELLCVATSAWLKERTGLPVDFQIQRAEVANERFGDRVRNPLGMERTFAGGGDGTPCAAGARWDSASRLSGAAQRP